MTDEIVTTVETQATDVAHDAERDTRSHLAALIEWAGKELKAARLDVETEISSILAKIKSHV